MTFNFSRRICRALILVSIAALLATDFAEAKSKAPKGRDITDTIYANPILTSFARLLQASPDVYTFLSSRGPFTVFVPTDSAFAKLPPGELDALLRPENTERRNDILLFHVINGKRLAVRDLLPVRAMFSCEGNPLTFRLTRTGVDLVQKARITHADIHCANGNINEIETVLMPPEVALPPLKSVPAAAPAANAPAVSPVPVIGHTHGAGANAGAIPVAPIATPEASPH
jgi:uncharacterized surface protein with fasciclin (FAS1) repeats